MLTREITVEVCSVATDTPEYPVYAERVARAMQALYKAGIVSKEPIDSGHGYTVNNWRLIA